MECVYTTIICNNIYIVICDSNKLCKIGVNKDDRTKSDRKTRRRLCSTASLLYIHIIPYCWTICRAGENFVSNYCITGLEIPDHGGYWQRLIIQIWPDLVIVDLMQPNNYILFVFGKRYTYLRPWSSYFHLFPFGFRRESPN